MANSIEHGRNLRPHFARVLTGISLRSGNTAQAVWLSRHQPGKGKTARRLAASDASSGNLPAQRMAILVNDAQADGVVI